MFAGRVASKPCLVLAKSGTCPEGDACIYAASHRWNAEDLKKRSICPHYQVLAPCPEGDSCQWLHEAVPLKPCIFFQRGKCWKGDKCPFPHVLNADAAPGAANSNAKRTSRPASPKHKFKSMQSPLKTRYRRPFDKATYTSGTRRFAASEKEMPTSDDSFASEEADETEKADIHSRPTEPQKASPKYSPPPNSPTRPNPPPEKKEVPPPKPAPAPAPTPVEVPGAQGIAAYKRGDLGEAIAIFNKTLGGTLDQSVRISLLSNRAHAYEKLGLRKRDDSLLSKAMEDCQKVDELVGSKGHFKTTLLRARVHLHREQFDDGVRHSKQAVQLAVGPDQGAKAADVLDRALAARIAARRKADELKKAEAAEQKKAAEERARVDKLLATYKGMRPHEIIGVKQDATESQVKAAYRRLAMKYHPDRPEGDHRIFQKIDEAFRSLSRMARAP